jgi:ABC-type bacteriocin/lantibiotic exporter with double-glycine peptidase domain
MLQPMNRSLVLSDIGFRFDTGKSQFRLANLTVRFSAAQFYCITGKTGCGKSTLLKLIAGLYKPNSGEIILDDKTVTLYENASWFSQIALVPANVKLTELSIYQNIAFGQSDEDIDHEWIHQISQWLELDSLANSLPEGFDSYYGDKGIRFSSGQIQKIGLARALYQKPNLLLLDEATDALDLASEKRIIDNILKNFAITIIFVSHRPSIQDCAQKVVNFERLIEQF